MRFLITGGAGFVGSHLADALAARNHELLILDDLSTGRRELIEHLLDLPGVRFVHGSVTDRALVDRCMREVDACMHLASAVGVQLVVADPLHTLLSNVRGCDVVMAAAHEHGRRLLFTSTSEVYGKQQSSSIHELADLVIGSPEKARWSYAIAKAFGESLAYGYGGAVVVRLFNTVGARQSGSYGMVLPRFVEQSLSGRTLRVFGDGRQTRCFTHVRDCVEAIVLLAERADASGTFNIGNPEPVSVIELARRVIERAGSRSTMTLVPYQRAYAPGFEELGERLPDISAIRELTGWNPSRTLDDAIDDVIAHARARRSERGSERIADAA